MDHNGFMFTEVLVPDVLLEPEGVELVTCSPLILVLLSLFYNGKNFLCHKGFLCPEAWLQIFTLESG